MESIQQALTVFSVLALLACTLYWLRSRGLAQFSVKGLRGGTQRRMQSIERLPLGPQHSLHLVRIAGRVVLVAVSPGGCSILDGSSWQQDDAGGQEER